MTENRIGVFGAGSLVGERLLLLLAESSARVFAYYRQKHERDETNIEWLCLSDPQPNQHAIHSWFCLAPIWILPDYFSFLEQHQVRRVVALSSTSRFSKLNSSDPEEQVMVKQLIAAEERLQIWAESKAIDWIILRPTLIYGYGRDKNITEIARFIKRFGFFPVFGKAQGLRQPVHAEDVAQACIAALNKPALKNKAYNISGAEILTYREMVNRIFADLNRKPRLITVPISAFKIAVACLRRLPRYRHWTAAMAERMNQDLVFAHDEAQRDLEFAPRPFYFTEKLAKEGAGAE